MAHVKAVGESSNEGAGYEKEVVSQTNNKWWNTKKGEGFPQWITFDLEGPIKAINFRNLDGCSTAPKDVVFYNSESQDGPWEEISRQSRPNRPGSAWWKAPLNSDKKFLKAEFLNNSNQTSNKEWSSYTYLYEVTVDR